MSKSEGIIFFDIASGQPLRTFAPNPWKTRYALNFKGVPYQVNAIQMPDITSVREKLGVPANRNLPDGTPYHTLPVIQDLSTGEVIGDSFEIALYLDKAYPSAPRLLAKDTIGLTAAFNSQVDGLFTKHVGVVEQMPFDPAVADEIKSIFAERFGITDPKDMNLSSEAREELFVQFENALGEFAKAYHHVGGTTDYFWSKTGTAAAQAQRSGRESVGPYLEGDSPVYADLIVGAWLAMMHTCLKSDDWQRIESWHGGLWGKLHNALAPLRVSK